jgi:hypothetical protein
LSLRLRQEVQALPRQICVKPALRAGKVAHRATPVDNEHYVDAIDFQTAIRNAVMQR